MSEYRTGFLNAFFGDFTIPQKQETVLKAKRENVLVSDTDLYHYTSLAGLEGIIKENGFWASDNRFMNDAEELKNGARLAEEALIHRANRVKSPSMANILKAVRDLITMRPTLGHLVACFSTARDSLEQWRAYGASGGICLRLGRPKPGEGTVFFGPDHLPFRVRYRRRPKMVHLLSVIRSYEKQYDLDRLAMPREWPDDHDQNYIERIYSSIEYAILAFKDEAFFQESEVRLVISYASEHLYNGGLRFRVTPMGLVAYLRTGDRMGTEARLPISEVMVGPSPRQELIAESLRTFFDHKDYKALQISLSRVPYRAP